MNVTFLKKHEFRIGDDRCLFRHDMHPRFTHVRSNCPYTAIGERNVGQLDCSGHVKVASLFENLYMYANLI